MSSASPPPDAPPLTVDSFLRAVLRSGLLDRPGLQEALRGVPQERRDDPRALAEHLVRTGKLSRFQAAKLLKGNALGLVLGPYQVLAPIGKGGMGTVFLARDNRSGQLVALKVLPPRRARTEERLVARFRREMDLCRRVAHPHLAWTYEVGEYRGVHYIAMEYIPGRTLSRLVSEQGPLSVTRAARLLAEVAAGLEHAHNVGLVHRDLKPSNIQVTPHEHAKVLDLGLALLTGEEAEYDVVGGHGYILGTMDYIAPEQTTNPAGVDHRSDLYSLGCTLYFALTGQPPFPGGTSRDKIRRQRMEMPVPLSTLRPDLPPSFVAFVERLMHKDPERRPASAAAVEAELRAWAAGDVVQPLDRPEEVIDAALDAMQGPGSSEYDAVPLPEVDEAELSGFADRSDAWPAWLVPVLAMGLGALVVAVVLLGGLLLWLAQR
jgi:serine/threonine protein kinase